MQWRPVIDRVRLWIYEVFSYYTVCIGVTAYCYDYATNTYSQTRLTRSIALLVNLFTLLLLPLIEWNTLQQLLVLSDGIFKNPVMVFCNIAYIAIHALSTLYTVLFRFARERGSCLIAAQLLQFRKDYMVGVPPSAAVKSVFNRIFNIKLACFLLLAFGEAVCQMVIMIDYSWYQFVHIFFVTLTMNILCCTTLNYFLQMWCVCRNLYQVNEQLQIHLNAMEMFSSDSQAGTTSQRQQLSASLALLMDAQWKCTAIAKRLHYIYRFQMLSLRFSCFMTNILMGYWVLMYIVLNVREWRIISMASVSYIVMTIDLYMIDMLNDKTVRGYEETSHILKHCNGFNLKCPNLNRMCEEFALRLSSCKLRLNVCGLFVADKRLLFRMLASVVSYTIVFMQFYLVLETQKS